MSTVRNSIELEIEKLYKSIHSKDKKVVALYGEVDEKVYQILNDMIILADPQLPEWSSISTANEECLVEDIKGFLLANTTLENFKYSSKDTRLTLWWKKRKIAKVVRQIDEIDNAVNKKEVQSRSRVYFLPIITTFSTIGATIAVPLISIVFLRTREIIEVWSRDGFIGIVTALFTLISAIILSNLISLFNNLRANRRDLLIYNIDKTLNNIYKKYYFDEQAAGVEYDPSSIYDRFMQSSKMIITKRYTFFYDTIDPNSTNYTRLLKYFKTLNLFNNTVIFNASFFKYLDERKVFQNQIPENKRLIIRLDKYKTKASSRRIMNFLSYQLSTISNLNLRKMTTMFHYFANSIYRFIDYSTNNKQILSLLLDVKEFAQRDPSNTLSKLAQFYFVDFFHLLILKALEPVDFEVMLSDILIYGRPREAVRNSKYYLQLKLDDILNRNVSLYKNIGFILNMSDYFIEDMHKNVFVDFERHGENAVNATYDLNEQLKTLHNALVLRNCIETELDESLMPRYDVVYKNNQDEEIFVKVICHNKDITFIDELEQCLENAFNDQIANLIIVCYDKHLYYRFIDGEYEIVNETI
ncbi:hypothetical protein OF376_02525 [Ureaplasma miroungigenitalium]|uniref:Uncharacterized protein n=1 Tax=Ureaplasma miroungigenitalium TaxID=1042321 RepID=A0ABT3BNQ4_9BACT|nr:hypothetical protein [Ureaplasma miroungigenitalium]MCV3728637.1 hypothetical protein [Ureaplasma miroungigenitalium]